MSSYFDLHNLTKIFSKMFPIITLKLEKSEDIEYVTLDDLKESVEDKKVILVKIRLQNVVK